MTHNSVLIISPFSFVPADAGHRRRVLQSLSFFKDCNITFLLYAFEDGWIYNYKENLVARMRQIIPDTLVYRGRHDIGAPPQNGDTHQLDEWYDNGFENYLKNLISYRSFDCVVIHNVWMSKYFDLFPRKTIKIIELHDIFSLRLQAFDKLEANREFFIANEKDEIFGINRSDIAISIQHHDNKWVSQNTSALPICIPYASPDAPEEIHTLSYRNADSVTFGFLGSSHAFNIHGIRRLIEILGPLISKTYAPIRLVVAGSVCRHLPKNPTSWWTAIGYVENEDDFFSAVDFVVAPIESGTGFKVKVADTAARGKPLLTTEHAAIGSAIPLELVVDDVHDLAQQMIRCAFERPDLANISNSVFIQDRKLRGFVNRSAGELLKFIDDLHKTFVFDLSGVPGEIACLYLAGLSKGIRTALNVGYPIIISDCAEIRSAVSNFLGGVHVFNSASDCDPTELGNCLWVDLIGTRELSWQRGGVIHPRRILSCGMPEWRGLFGDNRTWDPFYFDLIQRHIRMSSARYSGTVFLINRKQAGTFDEQDERQEHGRRSCILENEYDVASILGSILNGRITEIVSLISSKNWCQELIFRLADISGVRVTTLGGRSTYSDENVSEFWYHACMSQQQGIEGAGSAVDAEAGVPVELAYLTKTGGGLYELEHDGAGTPMVWASGRQYLKFRVYGLSTPSIRLRLVGNSHDVEGFIQVLKNDEVIERFHVSKDYKTHTVTLPRGDIETLPLEISLQFPQEISIPENSISQYKRHLSFLIYSIWFEDLRQ